MAERTVAVRLTASTAAYDAAMKRSGAATRQFATGAMGSLDQHSAKLRSFGRDASLFVSAPLIAMGGAAVKASSDFESTFAQMQGLAGVAADEVEGLKSSVLGLAGETAQSPQELAEALYFIRSAGLEGQNALDALEFSAKAAAAGMGETKVVADAVTSAMNAYGPGILSAAEATDVLAATAEIGKVEADQLAGQFGRLLGPAAELGITFDQVGGALGFLTRTSGSAELASTQLSGVLSKMLEPGQQGRKMLDELGWSVEGLRGSLQEKGLVGTVEELRNRLEASGEELSSFANDQQFIQGALALTGDHFDGASKAADEAADSAGKVDNAFGKAAETLGFKNAQAAADLQTAMIQIGDALAPIAADLAGFASAVAEWFAGLSDGSKTAVLALAGIAAAAGPLLSLAGNLTRVGTAFGLLSRGAETGIVSLTRFGSSVAAIGGSLGILYTAGEAINALMPDDTADLSALARDLLALGQTGGAVGEVARTLGEDFGGLSDAIARVGAPSNLDKASDALSEITTIGGLLGKGGSELSQAEQRIADLDDALASLALRSPKDAAAALDAIRGSISSGDFELLRPMLSDYDSALAEIEVQNETTAGSVQELGGAVSSTSPYWEAYRSSVDGARKSLQDLNDALQAEFDPLFGMVSALDGNVQAQQALNDAIAEHGAGSEEARQAHIALTESALGVTSAQLELQQAVKKGTVDVDSAKQTLMQWAAEGKITGDTAVAMAGEFDKATFAAGALDAKDVRVPVSEDGAAETQGKLDATGGKADELDGKAPHVSVTADTAVAYAAITTLKAALDALQSKTITVTTNTVSTGGGGPRLQQGLGRGGGQPRGLKGLYDDDALRGGQKALEGLRQTAKLTRDEMEALASSIGETYDKLSGGRDALIEWEEARDSLTEAVKNGYGIIDAASRSFDLNTEAGRENAQALQEVGSALVGIMQRRIEEGGTVQQAIDVGKQYVTSLRSQMIQMGYTAEQADQLIKQYGLIPEALAKPLKGPTLAEQLAKQLDAAERVLSNAETRLGNIWDQITNRFSLEDAQDALDEAEKELRKARQRPLTDEAVDEARDVVGEKKDDVDAAKKRASDAETALDKARAARARINRAFNPKAWREADREVTKARNEQERATNALAKAYDRLAAAQDRVAAARRRGGRADDEAIAEARANREDAALNLLEQSEHLIRQGRIREFRGIAAEAGLRKGEIHALIQAIKAENAARSDLQDVKHGKQMKVEIDYPKLAAALDKRPLQLDGDVKLNGHKVGQIILQGERRGHRR